MSEIILKGRKNYINNNNECWSISEPSCDDIAIIGAGVGGSYAAWKLRNKNLSVTVYEYNNRTGGRLHTVHLPGAPDINIELGGMRFIPPGEHTFFFLYNVASENQNHDRETILQ